MPYRVTCTVCDLVGEIADLDAVFDLVEEHERACVDRHSIEFERFEA